MSEKLVTKDLLKAFGDKSKRIFKYAPTIVSNNIATNYLLLEVGINPNDYWQLHIDISGIGVVTSARNEYTGDLKFFGNIKSNPYEGGGFTLVGNTVNGVAFLSKDNSENLFIVVETAAIASSVAIDILNYTTEKISTNVPIISAEFIQQDHELVTRLSNNNEASNIIGIINTNTTVTVGTAGDILQFEPSTLDRKITFKIPKSGKEEDKEGVIAIFPNDLTLIDILNDSKWAKYLKNAITVKFKQGDLKENSITFGGDSTTSYEVDPLEINNSVKSYTGYTEDSWVGKVKVNSKGLITEVEKEPELPVATSTILGGILTGYALDTIKKNYPVSIDENNKAYVHVPWNDTDTWNKVANSNDLGLIKIGYVGNDQNYPVELDSNNKAYVTVPWTDTKCLVATKTDLGSIKVGYTTTDKNYAVLLDSNNNAYVNVPWKDTTYNIATSNTAGLIKVGGTETYSKKPVELDNGVAYVNVKPSSGSMTFSATDNQSYSGPVIGYTESLFFTINIGDTFDKTYATLTIAESPAINEGVKTVVVRVINNRTTSVPFIMSTRGTIKVTNMLDADIFYSGLDIPAGKTLELVFTFWDVNDVSFNGGLSV